MRDIRQFKKERRALVKEYRRSLAPEQKAGMDGQIRKTLCRLYQFQRAKTVLIYMSTPIEVDTVGIIEYCWQHHKRVALPRCVDGTRLMDFYYVSSFDQLEKGTFGVLEPKTSCEKLGDYKDGICVVPALAYDRQGYRLGYGGGYYDRFLGKYPGATVGIIYRQNLYRFLPHGRYDASVSVVVSEKGFFYPRKGESQRRTAHEKPGQKKQ